MRGGAFCPREKVEMEGSRPGARMATDDSRGNAMLYFNYKVPTVARHDPDYQKASCVLGMEREMGMEGFGHLVL